jgi:hypothetical protein
LTGKGTTASCCTLPRINDQAHWETRCSSSRCVRGPGRCQFFATVPRRNRRRSYAVWPWVSTGNRGLQSVQAASTDLLCGEPRASSSPFYNAGKAVRACAMSCAATLPRGRAVALMQRWPHIHPSPVTGARCLVDSTCPLQRVRGYTYGTLLTGSWLVGVHIAPVASRRSTNQWSPALRCPLARGGEHKRTILKPQSIVLNMSLASARAARAGH